MRNLSLDEFDELFKLTSSYRHLKMQIKDLSDENYNSLAIKFWKSPVAYTHGYNPNERSIGFSNDQIHEIKSVLLNHFREKLQLMRNELYNKGIQVDE